MYKAGFLLVTVINIAVLGIVSVLLSAGGNGVFNSLAFWRSVLIGGFWILAFAYASWKMHLRGKKDEALLVAILPWLIVYLFVSLSNLLAIKLI